MPSGAEPSLPSPVSPQSPPSQETPPVSPPPPLKITRTKTPAGILLGKYQLGRLLGRGSFAKVHEASSLEDDNTIVAVKIIDKTKTVDAAMEPRIIREVSAMRRLQHHPNILKIHEVMATKTKIYLVMELASGGELFSKVLRCGRLAEPAARRYFSQLISALHFCHENGVAHRDVKPQNLLLDQNGNLKVSDFGLSALPEQLNDGLLHTACGTPAYTAPEVVRRKGYDGSKADAWSCGVILFVLLAGYLPFDDGNLVSMYKKIQRREFQFPAWISKPAKAIIWQLLDPNPVTRMSLTRLMETSWFKRTLTKSSSNSQLESLLHDRKLKHEMICNGVNAFDIISLSSGLDLSGLFKGGNDTRKEKRYITSSMEFDGVMERIREVGDRLGYRVEEGKRGVVGLGRGRVVVVVEVVQVADLFVLVEVKAVEGGGGGVEIEEEQWIDLEAGLGNIFVSWDSTALA
ncbi:CBL-interacting protein kinase 4 [Hibiscus syriacus]|uniref:non-specific serine/threonine protein kinase n=1 Tax=Hibiscus syriacus TaxID=106335 RepID=A0A6A3AFQ8_HIBSY|nr:CBL-interacting serine/threonine-protein kinase 7-like [Hibiscus syriacus]KAE8702888.1 CBL-interacting protein kinase 4 [Hibiscus syriacus]